MSKFRSGTADASAGLLVVWLAVLAIGAIGWVMNLIKIIGSVSEPITAMFIVRCVGAFAVPIGAVLGWF